MKDSSDQNFLDMQQAASPKLNQTFKEEFSIKRQIPENLSALEKISNNFFWYWNAESVELLRDMDSQLWEKYEQNPRRVLNATSELRLWQKSCEPDYVERVNKFAAKLDSYL